MNCEIHENLSDEKEKEICRAGKKMYIYNTESINNDWISVGNGLDEEKTISVWVYVVH